MAFEKNLREMLSSDGKLSSKRIITLIAFVCVVIAFLTNLILMVTMDAGILDGMITIVYAGLGVTVGENLLKKRTGEFRGGNQTEEEYYNPNGNRNYDTDDTRYQGRYNHRHSVDTQNSDQLGDN